MATSRVRSTSDRLPFPKESFNELRRRLSRLTPKVSLTGWDQCPPLWVSPSPGEGIKGAWFDVDAVVRVVRAMCALRHTKGRWARKPLIPDAWQIVWIIAPVFGWRYSLDDPDDDIAGARIVRTLYEEVPRKAGKSTTASAFATVLLCADGELGAEVYSAAASKDQARIVFDEAKKMMVAAPDLRGKIDPLTSLVRVRSTGGFFRVLSKAADVAHGLNVHGAVIDELHVHKKRDLVDAIETGTGARRQPLVIFITTADEGDDTTIYGEKHEYARKCAQRIVRDRSFYCAVWAAELGDDPYSPKTWRKAHPGLGKTVSMRYFEQEATKARATPSYHPTFCRLLLNLRIRSQTRWLSLTEWDAQPNIQIVDPEALRGRVCYGGLDLSATTDLTAYSLVFPDGDRLLSLHYFWMPEDGIDARVEQDQVPYREWAKLGYITLTEGKVVDYDKVIERIVWSMRHFDLRSLGHDRWQAGSVVQALEKHNIQAVPVAQTYQGMSASAKELERHVKQGLWVHGGNPVLRWMADAVEIVTDKSDNIRPVKPDRKSSSRRVDGITSSVMAVGEWMNAPETEAAAGPSAPSGNDDFFRPRERLTI